MALRLARVPGVARAHAVPWDGSSAQAMGIKGLDKLLGRAERPVVVSSLAERMARLRGVAAAGSADGGGG